mmetsp:Transcript_20547/g.35320  ORF Transcript_20547/g.35320 Transcript_20547/m.35320 type:complete len:393 (-) Transcript_20547:631-1809(-)|eukprot:CAMPEP_0196663038 /NCGR_PEP_ID=MMETSP1086-20130531/51211_1 /TAXON_ID=77921 /ORGANISM="Cyanoptyche  gloeocystis , Strain SAG4.97" /LENGTH=392 /DNA_ID=CAMNT_0041998703 /DNA_START=38 /DNA_END=1216 /DNA_ORIENTATION=-
MYWLQFHGLLLIISPVVVFLSCSLFAFLLEIATHFKSTALELAQTFSDASTSGDLPNSVFVAKTVGVFSFVSRHIADFYVFIGSKLVLKEEDFLTCGLLLGVFLLVLLVYGQVVSRAEAGSAELLWSSISEKLWVTELPDSGERVLWPKNVDCNKPFALVLVGVALEDDVRPRDPVATRSVLGAFLELARDQLHVSEDHITLAPAMYSKADMKMTLEDFFKHRRGKLMVYFNGDGMELRGDWRLGQEFFSFDEFVSIWTASPAFAQHSSKLLLIIDSSFSGHWVSQIARHESQAGAVPLNMAIQASCKEYQCPVQPGIFTAAFVNWNRKKQRKIPNSMVEQLYEKHACCPVAYVPGASGDWDYKDFLRWELLNEPLFRKRREAFMNTPISTA